MPIQLGQTAPDFEQVSTHGPIRFHGWLGDSRGVLFSHPRNFTPVCTGRNFVELLRAIDSLQLTDKKSIATPVTRPPGERVVVSSKLSDEEANRLFPQGFETLRPYLRLVDLGAGPAGTAGK